MILLLNDFRRFSAIFCRDLPLIGHSREFALRRSHNDLRSRVGSVRNDFGERIFSRPIRKRNAVVFIQDAFAVALSEDLQDDFLFLAVDPIFLAPHGDHGAASDKDGHRCKVGNVHAPPASSRKPFSREEIHPIAPCGQIDFHPIALVPYGTDKDIRPEHILHRILIAITAAVFFKRDHQRPRDGEPRIIAFPCRRIEIGQQTVTDLQKFADNALLHRIRAVDAQKLLGRATLFPLLFLFLPDRHTLGKFFTRFRLPRLVIVRTGDGIECEKGIAPSGKLSPARTESVIGEIGNALERTVFVHDPTDLKGKIPAILDGGMCPLGLESTIVDMTKTPPKVLRAGAVELDAVAEVIGDLDTEKVMVDTLAALKIPAGYVPKAELVFSAFYDNMSDVINKYYDANKLTHGARPVIFCMNFNADKYKGRNVMLMGESVAEYAKLLFERIREAENMDYNLIIAEGVPMGGMGTTVLSRLIKLSGGKVI